MKKNIELDKMLEALLRGDRSALANTITLAESKLAIDKKLTRELLSLLPPNERKTRRIGISGPPGVGKSSLIEKLGLRYVELGHKVAVLSVDPSSQRTKGSILGDKTRMAELALKSAAFIRPSSAGSILGGLNESTYRTIKICESAGYDTIIIETVGAGQSEHAVSDLCDCLIVVQPPVGGDDMQAIKMGLLEWADILVINKADGDLLQKAKESAGYLQNAIQFRISRWRDWKIPIILASAVLPNGVINLFEKIDLFFIRHSDSGGINQLRQNQSLNFFDQEWPRALISTLEENEYFQKELRKYQEMLKSGQIQADYAVELMIQYIFANFNEN
ncbi:MAG: methylmalonyl Co-A mutase-associated GTPase MeaB [Saprospiraceae bacterium]|nr:methylmalonyl Co-A mutase-associated GTPase MeaB [Saprospiraceae bacterium]